MDEFIRRIKTGTLSNNGIMTPGRVRLFLFYLGLLLFISVILGWLITRDWENLIPTWWQIVILAISLILVSLKNLIPIFMRVRSNKKTDPIPPLLQNRTIDDLLRPLGRGGRVNFLFRNGIDVNDLISHRRLVISGETGIGKTRTAIELIRKLILEDVVSPQGIFVPDPAFQFLDRAELRAALEKMQATNSVQLVFIDHFPQEVSELSLDLLSDLITLCEPALFLFTARNEDLWELFQKWLAKESFLEIQLEPLSNDQMKRLIDMASGVYGVQISNPASFMLGDQLEPSPGRLMTLLLSITNRGMVYATPDQVVPYITGSLPESLFAERARLIEADPGIFYLLEALALFRSCHIPADVHLVTQFAEKRRSKSKRFYRLNLLFKRIPNIQSSIPSLSAIDVSQNDGTFEYPQIILDNLIIPETACQEIESFFLQPTVSLPKPLLHIIVPFAKHLAWGLFILGCAAQRKNKRDQTVILISKAIKIFPHAWFFTHRSAAYAALNKLEKALNDANNAISLDPGSARAYTVRAELSLLKSDFSNAVDDYSKAIELDPKDAQAWVNRGNAYFAREELDKAINDFDSALQLVPGFPAAVFARGKAHNVRGRLQEAIADYDQAIVYNPEDVQLIYNRANAYDSINDYLRAIAEYDKLIALNPKDSLAYYNRGKDYHMLGNLEQAVMDYEQAILSNPHSAIAYRNRANALIRLNRLIEAKSDCREAERLEPNHPYTHARWGQYFAAREDYIGAVEKYELASRLIGEATHFNFDIGLCLVSSGNSEAGLAKIRERLKKGAKQEEIQEALRDYESQYAIQPTPALTEAISLLRGALI